MEPIKQYKCESGNILKISIDESAYNPREDDNLSKIYCFHKSYNIGDENPYKSSDFDSWKEFKNKLEEDYDIQFITPIYMYDHSGISISDKPFNSSWDSGQIGFMFIEKSVIEENFGKQIASGEKKLDDIKSYMINELEAYNTYVSGEVLDFIVEDKEGEVIDSCGNFYSEEDLLSYVDEKIIK